MNEALALLRAGKGYRKFKLRKAHGNRVIHAPVPAVKAAQRALIPHLKTFELGDHVHGFRDGRSIVTNAQAHLGARYMLAFDIKDFFASIIRPSIEFYVRSAEEAELVTLDNVLPQGAPTSPYLANIAAAPIDYTVERFLPEGARFTRYADDITITSQTPLPESLFANIAHEIIRFGFEVHKRRSGDPRGALTVTGLVLGRTGVCLPRKRIRAIQFQLRRRHEMTLKERLRLEGHLSFAKMVYGGELPASLVRNL